MIQSPVKIWRNQSQVARLLQQVGEIVTWTTIRVPPFDFTDQAPYVVALIELSSGERIECQVVDVVSSLRVGMRVRTVLRRIARPDSDGVIVYGVKAVPI